MQSFTSGWFLTFGMLAYWMVYIIFELVRTPTVTPQELRDSALRNKSANAGRDVNAQSVVTAR